MGLFQRGTMQPVGLSTKEMQEMTDRGWDAMRKGEIRPADKQQEPRMAYKKRKPRKK